jgi:hypothetical protein
MKQGMAVIFSFLSVCAAAALLRAQEPSAIPTSFGEARTVDTPILRVPFLSTPPNIDGILSSGEWDDASALSGFWYDMDFGVFEFMAPPQTQLQLYTGYDKENIYFCFTSPIYPVDSWLKARGRFPDTLMHPLYGMLFDDHTELELRPVADLTKGYQLGLLRWDVNPIGTITDWYWSTEGGSDYKYNSNAKIRTVADGKRWVIEYAIPLKSLRYGKYDANDANGRPLVAIPPRDGDAFRVWFARGIGGNGPLFNAFDAHGWNTTKTMLVFDSQSPTFQINEMGPLMDGILDMEMTVKNHNTRSETVQLGFHIENKEGSVYSSYQSTEFPNGIMQLRPGETRKVRLRQQLPTLSTDGDVLWFDVRSRGQPAKTMFQTRLIKFHTMEGGAARQRTFRERRIDAIEKLRPERIPYFDLRVDVSPYTKRLSAVVDRGIDGVKPEIKTAVEARLIVRRTSGEDPDEVHEFKAPFIGNFATFLCGATNIVAGEAYEVTVLAFDENMKIVGEQTETKPFINLTATSDINTPVKGENFQMMAWQNKELGIASVDDASGRPAGLYMHKGGPELRFERLQITPWLNNKIGLEDRVWEPFTPIVSNNTGFDTLNHRFTIDPSGLPAQIDIRPDPRELPLEQRAVDAKLPAETLQAVGRGPQLRAPLRLEAVINGKRVSAQVVAPAKAVRTWKSEIEYASTLRIGPLSAELLTRYDCDGSLHAKLIYGSDTPAKIDRLELVGEFAGIVDLALSQTSADTYIGSDRGECSLSKKPGVVWDSAQTQMELYYSRFIPWFWFGSADRGFSWYASGDEGWMLDKEGSTMQLERDKAGDVTWRVQFVNHPVEIKGRRVLDFSILTHPAKPKPENHRLYAWQYHAGKEWQTFLELSGDSQFEDRAPVWLKGDKALKSMWQTASGASTNMPYEQCTTWRQDKPPYFRVALDDSSFALPEKDHLYEDKAIFYLERLVRIGRWTGWWLESYSPPSPANNVAMGDAYFRTPDTISSNELPWQPKFLTSNMRNMYKRLAKVHAANNVPQRQHMRANNGARMLESFLWNCALVRETGAELKAYEIDLITAYPNSLYRTLAMNYTGLMTTLAPPKSVAASGDNPRFDRQTLGLALLHDFGVTRGGSVSGAIPRVSGAEMEHQEQAIRLLDRLTEFGFFQDQEIEKLPFWRNDALVRMGDKPGDESKVRVTVYRRPLENGNGYKAIFVILNESDGNIELPLDIRDSKRILGGANTQKGREILDRVTVPGVLQAAWKNVGGKTATTQALKDLETGVPIAKVIAKAGDKGEKYGPVFVPYHDYRIVYAECAQ